jgi:flagellar assembly protein FliH
MSPGPPNMQSNNAIMFSLPVRDVRLCTAGGADAAKRQREAERAAYERGQRDGEKALSEQLLAQRSELLELHQGILESLRNTVPQLARETEKALIELALEAAQKLVAGIPIKPKLIEAIVREALAQIEGNTDITVLLHPDDLALVRKHTSEISSAVPEAGAVRFSGSSEISRGGCIVQTRFGMIDGRRETKIEQLRKSLAA